MEGRLMRTITLSDQQWQVVGAALAELPYRVAAPVLEEISRQLEMAAAEDNDTDRSEAA